MRSLSLFAARSMGYCSVVVALWACSSLQPQTNSAGSLQRAVAIQLGRNASLSRSLSLHKREIGWVTHDRADSWMAPDAVSRAHLLYVTDATDGIVYALSLPSGNLVGKLTGFDQPLGDCVDKSGDVFIADTQGANVREFRHGARQPFRVLNDKGYYPLGCSVDPTTGNLAVTNIGGKGNGPPPGNVAIYKNAKGAPTYYSDPNIFQYGYCSYDGQGNLYIDGITPPSDTPQVAELPAGSTGFESITLNQSLGGNNVSALLWDGSYLAISSQDSAVIYQFQISGSTGTKVSSTKLKGATGVGAFWVEDAKLYAPIYQGSLGSTGVYPYPAGGRPSKKYYAVVNPWAATISDKAP